MSVCEIPWSALHSGDFEPAPVVRPMVFDFEFDTLPIFPSDVGNALIAILPRIADAFTAEIRTG